MEQNAAANKAMYAIKVELENAADLESQYDIIFRHLYLVYAIGFDEGRKLGH
jgi:hypothetical protein